FASAACAGESHVHRQLAQALTCGVPALETVREIAAAGSTRFGDGHAGYEFGEEMDIVSGVVLQDPLIIAGARTHHVVASLATVDYGFDAIVHARFAGDPQPVIDSLGLQPKPDSEGWSLATAAATADEVCPPTIELLPHPEGGFLLGCGWCNG